MSSNKILYVGGLKEIVKQQDLMNAFSPFGEIVSVNIPVDNNRNPRGFAFVEYESPEDATAALENMNNGELLGSVLNVNYSKEIQMEMKEAIKRSKIETTSNEYYEIMTENPQQFQVPRKKQKTEE